MMRKSKRLLQSKTSTPRGSGRRRTMSGSGAVVDQHELLVAQLRDLGLEVKDVEGDGNCLFRALGDQVDGHTRFHAQHRAAVCDYLATHRAHFQGFISDEDNRQSSFDHHLAQMRAGGTYGGNMELVAFARMRSLDIWVHQGGRPVFAICGTIEDDRETEQRRRTSMTLRPRRNVIHLAYHNYEHYSSIRPLGGPFDGVPRIHIHVVSPNASVEDLSRVDGGDGVTAVDGSDTAATRASGPPPSTDLEKLIMRSTGCVDLTRIRTLMAERRGHVDDVIEQLIEEMNAPTPAADEHGRGATPAFGASTAAHASVDTVSPSRKHTMMTSGSGAPKPATTTAVLEPAPATRKMSARERKEQTKKRRKRDKMQREAVKAAMEGPSATAAVASPRAQQGLMPATMTAKLSVLRI